jgi:two-component system sensor histidine kinase QseC
VSSIRRRLTVSLLAGCLAVFGAAGWFVQRTATRALVAQFDAGLLARTQALASLLELDPESGHIEFDYADTAMHEYVAGPRASYFELWFEDGTTATRSQSLGEGELPRRAGPPERPQTWDLTLPGERAGRATGVEVPVLPKDAPLPEGRVPPKMIIVVACPRADLDARRAELAEALLAAGAAALLLVAALLTVLVRRGLRPVERLGEQVSRIDAASLSTRVGGEGVPAELLPLAQKLDELLARLEGAFARERRMTAAVAHELRTPVAELRAAADIARRWPEDEALSRDLAETMQDVARRMTAAIDAILRYCRLESGQAAASHESVPLRSLLDELWRPHARRAGERGVRLANALPLDAVAQSDRELLGLAFGNLLDNAASFAAPGEVTAACAARDGALVVSVANETDQLEAADLERLTEPFWRKETARTDGRHAGLGLALVSSVARVLGGRARFALEGRHFVAAIELPATNGATPPLTLRSSGDAPPA